MTNRIFSCCKRWHPLIGLLLLSFSVAAQPKYNLKHYSTEDGLSHDRITCIIKDHEGFMWFGTWDGINRFDGHNFVPYKGRPGDSSNLENNKIRIIVEDKPGYLWVKTFDNKIYRFDKKKEAFLSIQNKKSPDYIKDIVVDRIVPVSNGDTWLLSARQGVLCAFANNTGGMPVIKAFNKSAQSQFNIGDNQVSFLFEDKEHGIWIGTKAGVTCLRKTAAGNYQKIAFNNRTTIGAQYSFTSYAQHLNNIYLGTAQGVMLVYNMPSKSFKAMAVAPGTSLNGVLVDNNNVYLTTTGKGLIAYNAAKGTIKYFLTQYKSLNKIYRDKQGLLWLEPDNGILKFDQANSSYKLFTQKKDAEALTIHTTYQVFEDAYNTFWACMEGGGFGYYDRATDEMNYFHNEPGTPKQQFSNVVTAMYADPTGVLWFSGYDRGINKVILQPDIFKHYIIAPNVTSKTENEVRAICEDHLGRLWVGTKAGKVILYKNGQVLANPFVNLPFANIGKVYTIYESKNHTIWLGTKGYGLIEAVPVSNDSSRYRIYKHLNNPKDPNSISSNMIYTVLEDSKQRIWVGTFGGGLNLLERRGNTTIFKNNNNAFKNYAAARAAGVRHLQEDKKGNIWMATTNGLVVFNPEEGIEQFHFHRYTKVRGDETSLGSNDVQYIHRDKAGTMWLGTFGGGLQKAITTYNVKDKISFKVYTAGNGLPNDIILSIASDSKGRLWIATENGLSEFNPKTEAFKNYNTDDGLPQTQFSESAILKSASGKLYLGCVNGYISFDPLHVGSTRYNTNIALTNFQVFNKSITPGAPDSILRDAIDQTKEIELKYDQNLINIDYTTLDYKTAQKIWYAYKLEGFDKQWNQVKTARQATYTNLPPGHYVFKVKSVSNYLFKNVPYKSVSITILPPPWKTWWAYLAYIILAGVIIEIARRIIVTMINLRNRIAVEQRVAELKLDFFTNISHELRTPLTLIVNPLKEISQHEALSLKGREYINLANKNANRMVRFVNQLLDFRKLQSGKTRLKIAEVDLVAVVRNTTTYFTELAHEKNINFNLKAQVPFFYVWVDDEKIDIVIYNLLANAFKYTPEGKTITVLLEPVTATGHVNIKITDEGTGVPEDKLKEIFELYYEASNNQAHHTKGTGIGLAFSKELITAHHGSITAANNEGEGMTFTVQIKTGKQHFQNNEADFVPSPAESSILAIPDIPQLIPGLTGADEHPEVNRPLVLIVEDNNELRKFLGNQLNAHYRVETAADGVIGLQKAIELVPELIISDVMMPNMNGIEMLDAIKHNVTTSHIPVVLLTAKSSVEHQMEGMRYGADFYVTKPFNTDYVLVLVESLIKQRRQLFDGFLGNKNLVQLSPGEILITSKDEQLLKQVIDTVEKGMADPAFNIDDVASGIGLGRSTFYKKLKSLTGLAPVEFVKEMRLKRAKQIIDAGEYTIAEVSYMVGFSSSGYFSTCFKEKYDQSPSQYLKTIKAAHPAG
jgi:signal transduction histidine kinase/ligand-binding sensor domain-containing protein/CheY-like chemotaxis protein/AraC-like DNA-binding protein